MRIALLSDLHVDHYSSRVDGLIDHFKKSNLGDYPVAEVCVVAGDIADGRFPDQYRGLFRGLRGFFQRILVVTGNHDYYKSTLAQTHHSIEEAIRQLDCEYALPTDEKCPLGSLSGVHFLNNSSVRVANRWFHGGTMWYPKLPGNEGWRHWMNDDRFIKNFTWDYSENERFQAFVNSSCASGDIVVTHHLPSMRSVAPRYKRHETNRFFVCDMEHFIQTRNPALWLHGHTHDVCDYQLGDTRVVCNPRGYPRELSHGPSGYQPKIIEV